MSNLNLNPFSDNRHTVPAIFPCKVDKFGGKLVSLALSLPKWWKYSHTVRVYLKSGADCSIGATVNSDDQPFCTLNMYTGEGGCGAATNLWISDGVTQGAASCVCVVLYCELGQNTWAVTHAQYCSLGVKLSFNDPETLPEVAIGYFGMPIWDTLTFLFTTLEFYLLGFPIYRLIKWLVSLGDFLTDWG